MSYTPHKLVWSLVSPQRHQIFIVRTQPFKELLVRRGRRELVFFAPRRPARAPTGNDRRLLPLRGVADDAPVRRERRVDGVPPAPEHLRLPDARVPQYPRAP
jgi:hypothetical protein